MGMPDPLSSAAVPVRRRRADAQRSADAILNAARVIFGAHPDASMEEIAAEAGVTRQTVYAHYPSRDALVFALVAAAAAEYAELLDAIGLETAPPVEALAGFLDAGWRFVRRHPMLLAPAAGTNIPRPSGNDPHDVVPPRLERLLLRGQLAKDFTSMQPASWLAAAVLGLQHTAAAQVSAGRLTAEEAEALCLESTFRLVGAAGGQGDASLV